MDFLATFLEGVVTFASPCLLPMLPLYLAYFAGEGAGESQNPSAGWGSPRGRRRMLASLSGFVLGFTAVFVALGVFSASLGAVLSAHATAVNVACGLVVIVFGIHYAGLMKLPTLERTFKPKLRVRPKSFGSAFVFGVIFAVGWTPCVGVFLGSALALAAVQGQALRGAVLLGCYSLGLALPFAISAVAIDRIAGVLGAIKRHYEQVNLVCGILLIAMGALMATGQLSALMHVVSSAVNV